MAEHQPDLDPHATLGVGSRASAIEIQHAYRSLIRLVHPDLSADPASAERAKRLNVARDQLLDPRRPHPGRGAVGTGRAAASHPPDRRSPAGDGSWERSRERGALDVFVAVCANVSERDVRHLLAARGRTCEAGTEAMLRAVELAQERGRATFAAAAAAEAVEAVRSRLRVSAGLAEVLAWTAFGLAIADVAPADAAVLLTPWREALDRRDSPLRAKEVVGRARKAARAVTIALMLTIELGLALAGVAALIRLAVGS